MFKTGLTPISRNGAADSGQVNYYRIKNGGTTTFYAGAPVRVSANGVLQLASNTTNPVGVFAGGMWIDPTSKRITRSLYVPSGTSTRTGSIDGLYTGTPGWGGVIAQVYDDPAQLFCIPALTSIPASSFGAFAVAGDIASGSSYSQRSNVALSLATGTSLANAMFRIIGVATYDNEVGAMVSAAPTPSGDLTNTWGVETTRVNVIFAKHAYRSYI